MGVSIQEYRQRIGCFYTRVSTLSSLKVRGYKRNTFPEQSKDFGTALRIIIRLTCLVAVVAAVIPSSPFVLDLTQFGDVEKNPGPNSAQDYKFHLISADDFEKLAATVVSDKFNINTILTFSKGPDGGRDAAAHGVNIVVGGGRILLNQELVVQVKHTGKESETIVKNVYEKEKEKVQKLVQNDQLDTYIIFTNYKISGGKESELVKCFKDAGATNVIAVGKETLSQWLNDSPELQRKVIRQHPKLMDQTAEQSIHMLEQYKKYLEKTIHVEAFTKAKEIVESGLVFITGVSGSGKKTVAKQLLVHLSQEYDFFDIISTTDFTWKWITNQKQVFFINNIDSDGMKMWCNLGDKLETAITNGAKFVFVGKTAVLKEVRCMLNQPGHHVIYDRLCDGAINLSDEQFNLSKDEKQEMLKKHVDMGDNDNPTKKALLKDDMVSHAAEIKCPCFPLVASSLGSRDCLEKFKTPMPRVYNQEFLDQFFKWVQSESCKSLTPKRLRQVSEPERSSADNGDNITGSTSESCELPMLKRLRLQSEPRSTADNVDNITVLKEILSEEYKNRARHVQPLPWFHKPRFELDKVYTKLRIVQRENTRSELMNKTVELHDIFDKHEYTLCENPRTILIEGSPGMGKTTLSLKLAYDWAMDRMPIKFPLVQLVLLIKCRDMQEGGIVEAIYEQLFPSDVDNLKEKLDTIIKEQPKKILLIVDGFDEASASATKHVMNMLTRKCLRDCYIVVTTRQEKGLEVRKHFDSLWEIKGYSENDVKEYITRHFKDIKDGPSLADRLIKNVEKDDKLRTLAINPLNTALLCVIFEYYDGKLPSTVTELYDNIVDCITKLYGEKPKCLEVKDKRLETWKETLGKVAYEGLLKDVLCFRERDLDNEDIQCTEMGFLYKEDSFQKMKPDHTYWFLHKTFQEYLAAFHFVEKVVRQELTLNDLTEQLKDTTKFMQVLMFVSGMLHKKDAVQHRAFVEKLGKCILSQNNKEVLGILCAVLSESPVDKDMASIMDQFLPWPSVCIGGQNFTPYSDYIISVFSRILNLLCTKDGVNKEVYFKYFSLSCFKENTSDLKLICETLTEKLVVRSLELIACDLADETARDLADMLSVNYTVQVLRLQNNNFTAESAKILAKGLCQNSTLEELDLNNNRLYNDGVKAITAVLTRDIVSSLHTLSLQHNRCDKRGAIAVAKMLSTNNTLKTLNMNWNPLGCEGVTCVARALKSNVTLNCLYLQNTDCGDEGVAAIADMLRSNTTLTKLFISNYFNAFGTNPTENQVSEVGAVALADALRDNNSLKELNLSDNIPDEEKKCLAEAWAVNAAQVKSWLCFL